MGCRFLPGGVILCGVRETRCSVPGCGARTVALCDWKLHGAKEGKTCSAKLCARHTFKPAPDKDLCPAHRAAYATWQLRHPAG